MISAGRAFAIQISIIFLLVSNSLHSQKTFTVHYKYKETKEMADSFYFGMLRPGLSIVQNSTEKRVFPLVKYRFFKSEGDYANSVCTYKLTDTTCSTIWDGFGYETIMIPGDTMNVLVEKKAKLDGAYWVNRQKEFRSVWFHNFDFTGKNRFIYSLFDSLSFNAGMLQYGDINLEKASNRLDTFYNMVTSLCTNRITFLDRYCSEHRIPDNIKKLAMGEIRSAYIINLLQPMSGAETIFSVNDYPSFYLKSMNNFTNLDNEQLSNKTLLYAEAVYKFINAYKLKLAARDSGEESRFQSRYQLIKKTEEYAPQLKEELLGYCLQNSLKKNYASFPTFLNEFGEEFPGSESFRYLDSLYRIEKSKPLVSLEKALACRIKDATGKTISVNEIFKGKPVLIDCWASWCAPCLLQMNYRNEIEKKYGSDIDVVYLSFDTDFKKWSQKNGQLNLAKNSFLLDKDFNSDFAFYFDIESIPRFMIFNKEGKLEIINAPRPSKQEAFAKALNSVLEKHQP